VPPRHPDNATLTIWLRFFKAGSRCASLYQDEVQSMARPYLWQPDFVSQEAIQLDSLSADVPVLAG
jgi:hypothetical protein